MDAKYPANLDPKLKEAYERVMGLSPASKQTQSSPNSAPMQQTPPPPPPQHESATPATNMKMVTEEVHLPASSHDNQKPTVVRLDGHDEKTKNTNSDQAPVQKSSGVMAMVLGLLGVLFFIGYALFWAQILGMNILPF